MSVRSLNKVMLIGNLTRDPELRYTPTGNAVCSFGIATNRSWTTESGEKREETEFHKLVSWNKLAELCSQLLTKGRKVFVEGRLQTRSWVGQDGAQRTSTEIVIDDMIILDSRRVEGMGGGFNQSGGVSTGLTTTTVQPTTSPPVVQPAAQTVTDEPKVEENTTKSDLKVADAQSSGGLKEDINPDDIPF